MAASGPKAAVWTEEYVPMLLENPKIEVNLADYNGRTALRWGAEFGRTKLVRVRKLKASSYSMV